ncbi:hypothetical protein C8R43DRAFT_1137962 [Mycena crocata]|nr:hypothetical protein C8R43DRAFT_1137962 [Mycena crocata]
MADDTIIFTTYIPHSDFTMRFSSRLACFAAAAAVAHLSAASVIPAASLESRVTPIDTDCIGYVKYMGAYDGTTNFGPGCRDVTYNCLSENGTSIWSHKACVAAATCQGVKGVVILNQCQNHNVAVTHSIPNMSSAIYGGIVGSCAASGCPITQQNYIDFIYSAMSDAGVTDWPDVNYVLEHYWKPILAWTATGNSVPYANFNDWLHWSNS